MCQTGRENFSAPTRWRVLGAAFKLSEGVSPFPIETTEPGPGPQGASAASASLRYRNEQGHVLFEVLRFPGKDFRQRRPNPGRAGAYVYKLDGVSRVPYRLPELLRADPSAVVFIVEGEKGCGQTSAMATTKRLSSDPLKQLGNGDPERLCNLHQCRQARVEIAAFDLLVVGQRPVVPTDKVHL